MEPVIGRLGKSQSLEVCLKVRLNVLLVAILVFLGAIISILVWGQKTTAVAVAAPAGSSAAPTTRIQVQMPSPLVQSAPKPAPAFAEPVQPLPPAILASSVEPAPATASPSPETQADANKRIKWGAGQKLAYTAVEGDTLSNVAGGLFGSDTKKNREAVMAANPSLQADPDRVLIGKTYLITPPDAVSPVPAASEPKAASIPTAQPEASKSATPDSEPVLKYTAQHGDSLSALAAGLLGEDSKTNRDAIISHNQSLQHDPDRLVVGKTYKIPASNGLSAAPAPAAVQPSVPTTQPDADGVVQIGTGRELRYTARAGDNVSRLAEILLGSDTEANRDAIINNNATLKSDPNRVVAGQTYWIPAPAAPDEQR
jgi:hypothetical protein